MVNRMIYYSRITNKNTLENATKLFKLNKISLKTVIFDEENSYKNKESTYNLMKNKLIKSDKCLTIDTIKSLGKDNREIANELKWIVDNDVKLVVLDISQTKVNGVNAGLFLYEVYKKLADIEIDNVKKAQRIGIDKTLNEKKKYGRPQMEYPINWEELYSKWKQKEISSNEFIKLSGLKKPTFYNMLKKYMIDIGEIGNSDSVRDKEEKALKAAIFFF